MEKWARRRRAAFNRDDNPRSPLSERTEEIAQNDESPVETDFGQISKEVEDFDIFATLEDSLTEKITKEVFGSIAACVKRFKDRTEYCSLCDLKMSLKSHIDYYSKQIGKWAVEGYSSLVEKEITVIHDMLNQMADKYSQRKPILWKSHATSLSFPKFNTKDILKQFVTACDDTAYRLSREILDAVLMSLGLADMDDEGLGSVGSWISSTHDEKREEKKYRRTMTKRLSKSMREDIYIIFAEQSNSICEKIRLSVKTAIDDNEELGYLIKSHEQKFVKYVKTCINRTRNKIKRH